MKQIKSIFIAALFLVAANVVFSEEAKFPSSDYLLDKSQVNAFDSLLMFPYSKSLDIAGTAFSFLAVATSASLFAAPKEDFWKIGAVGAQAMLSAYAIRSVLKYCVERNRPYMFFEGAPLDKIAGGDYLNSFPSGHTTLAFAAAGSMTFMFCKYYPSSKFKLPAIVTSYALALISGGLRIASGNHFATDVLAGVAIGSICGYLMPLANTLWFKPARQNIKLDVGAAGFSVRLKLD